MCQLNSYFVPKILREEKVLALMQEAGMDCCECMDDYKNMPEFVKDNAFFSAPQRCNCGSVISKLQDTDYKNFAEFKVLSIEREIARLERIRDFMLCEGYSEQRERFEVKREYLSEKMSEQSAWIGEKESVLVNGILSKTNLSDEEKSRQLHETVYPLIRELLEENEKNPEVIRMREEYQTFVRENVLMWDSCIYTLESAAEKKHSAIPLTLKTAIELSGGTPAEEKTAEVNNDLEDDREELTITIPSNNIFDVIEAEKNREFSDCISEFQTIERFVKRVLAYTDHIKLFAYWQTDACNILGKKIVWIEEFTIDSLLTLPYLTILEIRKTK